MTEHDWDSLIRAALLEAAEARWAGVTETGPALTWSPRRQREVERFLRAPFQSAKKRTRPLWSRALRLAACLALVFSLTLAGLYSLSPTVRAWVDRIVVQWTSVSASFIFTGTAEGELGEWRPDWLPEGYEENGVTELGTGRQVTFVSHGNKFHFDYSIVVQGGMFDLDNEHSDYTKLELNGQPAHLFLSNTEGWPSSLIWFDESGGIAFQLMGDLDREALLRIAGHVERVE